MTTEKGPVVPPGAIPDDILQRLILTETRKAYETLSDHRAINPDRLHVFLTGLQSPIIYFDPEASYAGRQGIPELDNLTFIIGNIFYRDGTAPEGRRLHHLRIAPSPDYRAVMASYNQFSDRPNILQQILGRGDDTAIGVGK